MRGWKRDRAGDRSLGLRHRLVLYWLFLVLAVFAALLLVLSLTGVLSGTERQVGEVLSLQQRNAQENTVTRVEDLAAQCVDLSEEVSRRVNGVLSDYDLTLEALSDNPEALGDLQERLLDPLDATIHMGLCSGAFAVLDATVNTGADPGDLSRTGVYLRAVNISAAGQADRDLTLFRGDPELARRVGLPLHNRWNLEFDVSALPGYRSLLGSRVERLAGSGFWSGKVALKDTWENAFLLCVPVLDRAGVVRGLCGAEVSEVYCRLLLPGIESPYGTIAAVAAPRSGTALLLSEGMVGETRDMVLSPGGVMEVEKGKHFNTYRLGGETYFGVEQPLPVRLLPASGGEERLYLVNLISDRGVREAAALRRVFWIGVSLLMLGTAAGLAIFFSKRFVSPILAGLESIRDQTVTEGQHSGISELDELIDCLQNRQRLREQEAVQAAGNSLPPDVEQLLGQFRENVATLTPTEWNLLQLYIDGHDIQEAAGICFVSVNTVKKHNTNINRKLGVTSREELMLYIDLFRRCDRLHEITGHPLESTSKCTE